MSHINEILCICIEVLKINVSMKTSGNCQTIEPFLSTLFCFTFLSDSTDYYPKLKPSLHLLESLFDYRILLSFPTAWPPVVSKFIDIYRRCHVFIVRILNPLVITYSTREKCVSVKPLPTSVGIFVSLSHRHSLTLLVFLSCTTIISVPNVSLQTFFIVFTIRLKIQKQH